MPTVHSAVDSGRFFIERSPPEHCWIYQPAFDRGAGAQNHLRAGLPPAVITFHDLRGLRSYPLNNNPLPTSYPQVGKTCGFPVLDPRAYGLKGTSTVLNYTRVSY